MTTSIRNLIQPESIKVEGQTWNVFNHSETEIAAVWVVCYLQQRGRGWESFSATDLARFYSESVGKAHDDEFALHLLVPTYLTLEGGTITVLDTFISVIASHFQLIGAPAETASPERKLEWLQEAARRANWDAKHGPRHLRTGRFK